MEIHQEEQKNSGQQSYAQVNSRLLFRLENQQFLQQQQNDGDSARRNGSRFDSVFDTLRVLENKDQNRAVKFKWISAEIKQVDLLSKQNVPCVQCQSLVRANSSIGQIEVANSSVSGAATPSGFKYPKTSQTRGGWLHIIKIPESNFISGDDSHQAIVLTNQLSLSAKKAYCIFVKGKIYRFESENHEMSQKVLDIKNCNMDMITIQRPDQTVAQSISCNLEQGIQVRSLSKTYLFMSCARSDASTNHKSKDIQDWFEYFKKYGTLLNMKSYYEVGNLLGKGNFAKVYEATHFKTKEKFALKTIEKKMISKNKRNFFALLQEVTLLRRLDHKNIIHLHEVYESEHNIHLILECLNGGELFERIKKNGSYNEKDAAIIMRCILEALVAMHKKSIVHRDLKPENLLFKSEDIGSLKIVDFGLSTLIKDSPLNMRCGSPGYVAPEILNDLGYGCKVDIFSAGIILYILLTGKFVFSGRNYREILMKNKECLVPFPPQYWTNLTPEAKDLVKKMLEKDPKARLSAQQALEHPWFTMNGNNLQNLQLNFEEVDDLQLTDEEPSLVNSVNLQLVTTSPIWNKTRMRDEVRKVNAEQDKRNTFTTPMPQPKFFGAKRMEPQGQRKELKGIVVQNLFNNNQNSNPEPQPTLQQLRKQHQTPNVNSSSQRVQNTTLNMLQSLFRKADQPESIQKEKEDKNSTGHQEIFIKEEQKINDPNISIHNQSQDVKINYSNLNQSYCKQQQQENTQTSTPNQQHHGLSQQQMDQNYERIAKKWQEPHFLALSKIMEDAALEDAKSQLMMFGSQINPNDPNYEEIKNRVIKLRQISEQQQQGKMLFDINRHNNANGQSMHQQQIHDFLMKDILPNSQYNPTPYNGPQPYFPGQPLQNQNRLVSHSPNVSSKYSPSQIKNSLPVIKEEGQLRKYLREKNGVRKSIQEEDDESFGDLEIEENADRSLNQNKIVDFNAHSNNCLLKSSTVEQKNNGGFSFSEQIMPLQAKNEKSSPEKQDIEDGNPDNVRPGNPSSLSVNSASYMVNSRLSNNINGHKSDSFGNKSQLESNSNSNPLSQFSNSQSSQQVHRYSIPKAQHSQNKKSQFWVNSLNPINDGEETPNGEEANVEGHIDTEEQPANLTFYVPTTPGSIYGGSRNIMRHSINNVQGPLQKYLDMNAAHNRNLLALTTQNNNYGSGKFSLGQMAYNQTAGNYAQNSEKNMNSNPMNQSGKSSNYNGYSRPNEFQQNPTFNGSQYFQKEGNNSKANLSQAQLYRLLTNHQGNDEEVKEELSPPGFPGLTQNNFESMARPFGQSVTPNQSADQRKKVQLLNKLRQEDRNISQSSDNARSGTSNLPEVDSNEQLQKQLKDLMRQSFPQNKMVTESIRPSQLLQGDSQDRQNLNASVNGSLNPYSFSDQTPAKSAGINRESMSGHNPFFSAYGGSDMQRFGSAQVSRNGDDKSAIDYQTAYQSMVDLHEMQKQNNSNSANGGLSWQGQHSIVNNNSQKSFIDMSNKDCQNQILTEQDILNQNNQASGGGSELERVNNYSQEVLKPQNSYNLGEFKNQRQNQVNNLRKTLKNQI